MDKSQPIRATLKSGERVFILLVEDEKLKESGKKECYCYASSHCPTKGGLYFKSPDEALDHAIDCASAISPVIGIEPIVGFESSFKTVILKKTIGVLRLSC